MADNISLKGRKKLIGKIAVIPRAAYVFLCFPDENGGLSVRNPATGRAQADKLADPVFGMLVGYEIWSAYPYGIWWFVLAGDEKILAVSEGSLNSQFNFAEGLELCPF